MQLFALSNGERFPILCETAHLRVGMNAHSPVHGDLHMKNSCYAFAGVHYNALSCEL